MDYVEHSFTLHMGNIFTKNNKFFILIIALIHIPITVFDSTDILCVFLPINPSFYDFL